MRYATYTNRYLYNVLAVLITLALLLASAASVDAAPKEKKQKKVPRGASGDVTLVLQAGDAKAVSDCLNSIDDGKNNEQYCYADGLAEAGDLTINNVNIVSVYKGRRNTSPSDSGGNITLILNAGDATAVATCANEIKDGSNNYQDCTSSATAEGGDITIHEINIKVISARR